MPPSRPGVRLSEKSTQARRPDLHQRWQEQKSIVENASKQLKH